MKAEGCYLGIDFGTSGARAIAITADRQICATVSLKFNKTQNWAESWKAALFELLGQLSTQVRRRLRGIAINGTSATVLICDPQGQPLDQPLLYNDDRGAANLDRVRAAVPANHPAISATSSLAKLLWWQERAPAPAYFLHQADWLAFLLHGRLGISDHHNALKLGYDVGALRYPDWLTQLNLTFVLPDVVAPGTAVAPMLSALAAQFEIPLDCLICTGTTDSIAAFLASEVQTTGEAVTSLGSTLVLKLLSHTRVDNARYGIYSHRLGERWLVGGASNTGGRVLQQFFSDAELVSLSQQIAPDRPSSLDYYPLLKPGERFPIHDPGLLPRLELRPADAAEFLQGLLEGMARIEARGYQLLQTLGASPLTRVYTAGGGAKNLVWTTLRSRYLRVPVLASAQTEAAYGTALLTMQSIEAAERY